MPIVPKSEISERFTVLNQHFTYLPSFFRFHKRSKTLTPQLLQLGEVLDGADHLAGVAVLVRRRTLRAATARNAAVSSLLPP